MDPGLVTHSVRFVSTGENPATGKRERNKRIEDPPSKEKEGKKRKKKKTIKSISTIPATIWGKPNNATKVINAGLLPGFPSREITDI